MRQGDLIADRFYVERLANAGGMGAVWKALDRRNGAHVAIKALHQGTNANTSRFVREARALSDLDHPHIVRYVAHGTTRTGESYLAIEWLDGFDLAIQLSRRKLKLSETLRVMTKVALGLGAAHARGMVHRDIKPSNLFLPGGDLDRVKIVDFGIARIGAQTSATTRAGAIVGTPAYMAPEQVRGERAIDARADVFSIGCVLFECLTGRAPFIAEHIMALLAKVLLEEAPRVSETNADVPDSLDDLVARMLSKERNERPADGTAVMRELEAIAKSEDRPLSRASLREPALTSGEQRLLCVLMAGAKPHEPPAPDATPGPMSHDPSSFTPTAIAVSVPAPSGPAPEAVSVPLIEDADAMAETVVPDETDSVIASVRAELLPFGARVDRLIDGSILATLSGGSGATDQAARGARCALAMRALLPGYPIALATGRGSVTERWPVGDVIDRAAELLRQDALAGPRTSIVPPPPGPAAAASPGLRLSWGPIASPGAGASLGGQMLSSTRPRGVRIDDVTAGLLDVRFDVGGDAHGLLLHAERELVEATRTLLGRPTPFVGRERELGVLLGLFDECAGEPVARAVLVTSGAGVGKSRLRYEFLERIKSQPVPVDVWIARGDPMSAGAPFGMIAPMLRRAAGIFDGEPLPVRRQKLRARLGRNVSPADLPRVAEFLGELVGTPFVDHESVQLRVARSDAMLMGDQMRRAFEDLLLAECRAQPVILVLEDLQWGDLPSVQFLDSALRNLEDRPLLVLAIGRSEVKELFPRLWEDRALHELRLAELTKKSSDKLVRAMLGEAVPQPVVDRLVAQAAGNAFFLEELIRSVAEGRSDLPATVLAMVEARLASIDPDTRRVLRAASVFGQVFWLGGVAALLGGRDREQDLAARLEALIELEIVTRHGDSKFPREPQLAFRQTLVREAAYAMLTDADRVLGHRLAAEWLERAGEADAQVLAEHFERARENFRAVGLFAHAAEQALEGNDFTAAIARAEAAIAGGADAELRGRMRVLQAEAHRWTGANADVARCALEAAELLPRMTPRYWDAVAEVGVAYGKLGRIDDLVLLANAMLLEVAATESIAGISACSRVAVQLVYAGRYDAAQKLFEVTLAMAAKTGDRDPVVRARVEQARAVYALNAGDPVTHLHATEASVVSCEQAGDLRTACLQRVNVGNAYMELGFYAESERALREALASALRMSLGFVTAIARTNLGYALAMQDQLDEARALLQKAHEASLKRGGDKRLTGGTLVYLALTEHRAKAPERAEAYARDGAVASAPHPPVEAYARAVLSRVLLGRARKADAVVEAERAMAILRELGGRIESGEATVHLALAESLQAAADPRRFDVIRAAHDRLMERATLISDPALRRSFLTRVEDNAALLSLARSIGITGISTARTLPGR